MSVETTARTTPASIDRPWTPLSSSEHVRELDGVRAIAIWMVLLGHGYFGWQNPEGTFDHVPAVLYQIVSHGWLGVDLFFVLSGLLITGILLDTKDRPNYLFNFYSRRVLRILPLYVVCLVVFSYFYVGYGRFFLISIPFLSNFASAFDAPIPHGPGVFWSLCVEEHFYLLWPFVVMSVSRKTLARVALGIFLLTPALRAMGVIAEMKVDMEIYQYSFFRFDGLALGALLALWMRDPRATVQRSQQLAAVLVVAAVVVTLAGLPFDILKKSTTGIALRYTQVNLIYGAFILLCLSWRGSQITSPLRSPIALLSAKLSYCLYLVHLSVGDAYMYYAASFEASVSAAWGGLGAATLRTVIMIVLSFAIALLSQRYLEGPAMRLKLRTT